MELGIAVIGLGRWGPNYLRVFGAVKEARVTAAVDSDVARVERLRGSYERVQFLDDYRSVLTSQEVQAVVVATPTVTHYELVKAALLAGKHVLCEKPLTASRHEAWELVGLARRQGVRLMMGHVFLFNAGVEYLAGAVSRKEVGPVFYISAVRTNLGPFRSDVNAAWDLASHDLYIFSHVLRERPSAVAALGFGYLRGEVEDIVFLTLRYPSGAIGHIHVSWLDPKKIRHITLVGEQKMVTWDESGVPGPVMIYDRSVVRDKTYSTFGEFQLLAREGDVMLPRIAPSEPLAAQAREFVERCRRPDRPEAGATAVEGAEVVDILAAASQSMRDRGKLTEIEYGNGDLRSS